MTTINSNRVFEPTPSFIVHRPHLSFVNHLLALNDGSILSCSSDKTAKRWMSCTKTNNLQLLGTYQGHQNYVLCAIEKDDNLLCTASSDETLKVWNTTTCECLDTLQMSGSVHSLLKTKEKTRFVCGLTNGRVEMRQVSDLGLISSFDLHGRFDAIKSICELEDGSFVSASYKMMKGWDEKGTVLQTFSGHSAYIKSVIELNRDVVVSASLDKTLKMWSEYWRMSSHYVHSLLTLYMGWKR